MLLSFLLSVLLPFALTALFSKKWIPTLISRKMGQPILEIGPRWHKSKEGTPTMGGLFFIGAVWLTALVAAFFFFDKEDLFRVFLTLGMATLFGLIGWIDDRAKLLKKQNEGLAAWQKFLLQIVVSVIYLFISDRKGLLPDSMRLPFTDISLPLGAAYAGVALLLLVGFNNSVNLTDGIDGLCASVTATVAAFFAVCAYASDKTSALLAGMLFGACIGFLVYNWHPARIFMGDTGSLFLGGMVCGIAFLEDMPLVLLVVGLVYVLESASVILQVGYFKLTHGKRLFKMAPIHHHFEKCGWSEPAIVLLAVAITALLAIITYCFWIR